MQEVNLHNIKKSFIPECEVVVTLKKLFVILPILLVLSLSGCAFAGSDIENLMSAPKSSGVDAQISDTIQASVGQFEFKYPQNGKYRSAVVLENVTGTTEQSCVAFYKKKSEISTIYMAILKNNVNTGWEIMYEFPSNSADIDEVNFGDIDGNGSLEVMVGWKGGSYSSNKLSVVSYSQEHDSFEHEDFLYSKFCCADFDSDGLTEILLFPLDSQNKNIHATLMKYNKTNSKLANIGQVNMNSNIIEYSNVLFGNVAPGQVGVVVDSKLNDDSTNSDIIYWNNKSRTLESPLYDDVTKTSFTKRFTSDFSQDINNDGIIEIPVAVAFPGYNVPESEINSSYYQKNNICYITKWSAFNTSTSSLSPVRSDIINHDDGYRLSIPTSWENKTTGKFDHANRTFTLSYWHVDEKNNGASSDAIFKVKVFTLYSWDNRSENEDNYRELARNNRYVYALSILKNDGDCKTTFEDIQKDFSLL